MNSPLITMSAVTIPTADQERAKIFYTQVLGFTLKHDLPCPGHDHQRWIALTHPQSSVEVVLFTSEADKARVGSFMNITWSCENIETTHRQLVERGVTFTGPIQTEFWGKYAIMQDSEGNTFCLMQDLHA